MRLSTSYLSLRGELGSIQNKQVVGAKAPSLSEQESGS